MSYTPYAKILALSSDPASPTEGFIYYHTTLEALRIYSGGAWNTLSGGGGTTHDPAYSLEDGSGYYSLEDGSGIYLLE